MKPIRTTILMAILAAAAAAVAAAYYPWPKISRNNEMVGKSLFEAYKATQVRGIQIMQFNRDRGFLERVELRRKGEKWIIPAKENFVVSNDLRISALISSLQDKEVLEFRSDAEQDYLQYGVLDPSDFASVKKLSALGTKVVLTDRSKKEIASLIVGLPFKNNSGDQQRFVRVPGQPNVYLISYPAAVLTTEFAGWVTPNPLGLKTGRDAPGQQIASLTIENYRIDFAKDKDVKSPVYRAAMQIKDGRLGFGMEVPVVGEPNKYQRLSSVTPEQQALLQNVIAGGYLTNLIANDVTAKSAAVSAALRNLQKETDDKVFESMNAKGFAKSEKEGTFNSAGGSLSITTPGGVRMDVYVGSPAGAVEGNAGLQNRYVMVHARVNEKLLPKPVRPDDAIEGESSEANKNYLRLLQEWETNVANVQRTVDSMNAMHAPWYYMVSENLIEGIRPDLKVTPATARPAAPENKVQRIPEAEPGSEPQAADSSNVDSATDDSTQPSDEKKD